MHPPLRGQALRKYRPPRPQKGLHGSGFTVMMPRISPRKCERFAGRTNEKSNHIPGKRNLF